MTALSPFVLFGKDVFSVIDSFTNWVEEEFLKASTLSDTRYFVENFDISRDTKGKALYRAIELGYSDIVRYLGDYGANLKMIKNYNGFTINHSYWRYGLMSMIGRSGNIEIAQYFLDRGFNTWSDKLNMFTTGCLKGNLDFITFLTNSGFNLTSNPQPLIEHISWRGDKKMFDYLTKLYNHLIPNAKHTWKWYNRDNFH